jgi:hypothetical protein
MPQIYDMEPTALLPLRRKACWGFFALKIRRLRPGLNPRTWVLKASTLHIDHQSRIFGISARIRTTMRFSNCVSSISGIINGLNSVFFFNICYSATSESHRGWWGPYNGGQSRFQNWFLVHHWSSWEPERNWMNLFAIKASSHLTRVQRNVQWPSACRSAWWHEVHPRTGHEGPQKY